MTNLFDIVWFPFALLLAAPVIIVKEIIRTIVS